MYGIITYIWLIFIVDVGKYSSPMDPVGLLTIHAWLSRPFAAQSLPQKAWNGGNPPKFVGPRPKIW